MCRKKAAEAKRRAAGAPDPSIKILFEEVASGWLRLAEQMELALFGVFIMAMRHKATAQSRGGLNDKGRKKESPA
jgi:hypothetical protein